MSDEQDEHVKIVFYLEKDEDDYPPEDAETMWARPVEGGYEIDNIPFYARGIAMGDVVQAEEADDGMLEFKGKVVRRGGHSTYRVLIRQKRAGDPQTSMDELVEMGLEVEQDLPSLLAVDVPPERPLGEIRNFFFDKIDSGEWEVEEAWRADTQ